MKKKEMWCNILLAVLFSLAPAQEQPAKGIAGTWLGVLKVPGAELRIVFRIEKKADGSLSCLMDSPDQGAKDIPTSSVRLEGEKLTVEVQLIAGLYQGTIKPGGDEIEGTWKQGGMDFPLPLKRTDKIEALKRPQEPKPPYPYVEEEVVYENKPAGVKLAGTLTLPGPRGGPYAAVILITGSGPEDRNEMVAGHKPFLILADYLTRRGIAVLRVDDRGVGGSTGVERQSTTRDFAGDVLAGVAFLKTRKEIDPGKIGLIGHSEGGLIAPLAATLQPDAVAFIVLMAGPGLPGDEILLLQGELINRASGASDEEVASNRTLQQTIFRIVKEEKDPAAAEARLRELIKKSFAEMSPEKQKTFPPAVQEAQLNFVLSPWFRFFLSYDPRPTLRQVKCPVLAINGEKDLQVPAQVNLKAVAEALQAGGNTRFTIKELPGLNHLFQTCHTCLLGEYVQLEETMAPAALQVMGDWIVEQTKKK